MTIFDLLVGTAIVCGENKHPVGGSSGNREMKMDKDNSEMAIDCGMPVDWALGLMNNLQCLSLCATNLICNSCNE